MSTNSPMPESVCTHCGMTGHTVDKCYKIHGYPPGFKSKKSQAAMVYGNPHDQSFCNASSTSVSPAIWHSRLGHPTPIKMSILHKNVPLRRSTRTTKIPSYLTDFECSSSNASKHPYPLASYMSFTSLQMCCLQPSSASQNQRSSRKHLSTKSLSFSNHCFFSRSILPQIRGLFVVMRSGAVQIVTQDLVLPRSY